MDYDQDIPPYVDDVGDSLDDESEAHANGWRRRVRIAACEDAHAEILMTLRESAKEYEE